MQPQRRRIMRITLWITLSVMISNSHAFFVYHNRPDIKALLKQCQTPSLIHTGRTDINAMYLNPRKWDFRGRIPLEVIYHHFKEWEAVITVDDPTTVKHYNYGTLSDAITNMLIEHELCLLMDWQTKSYYLFKPGQLNEKHTINC